MAPWHGDLGISPVPLFSSVQVKNQESHKAALRSGTNKG